MARQQEVPLPAASVTASSYELVLLLLLFVADDTITYELVHMLASVTYEAMVHARASNQVVIIVIIFFFIIPPPSFAAVMASDTAPHPLFIANKQTFAKGHDIEQDGDVT